MAIAVILGVNVCRIYYFQTISIFLIVRVCNKDLNANNNNNQRECLNYNGSDINS